MKKLINWTALCLAVAFNALVLAAFTGCVTANPNHTPTINADGSTNLPPAYVPDTGSISNTLWKIQTGLQASEPVNPYAKPLEAAAALVGGIVTIGSGLFASSKSKKAAKAEATSKTLATGVVKANAQAAVLEVASSTPHFADVANHLNEATP